MRRFQFRLEKVRRVKELREQLAQQELSRAVQFYQQAAQHLEQLKNELSNYHDFLRRRRSGTFRGHELALYLPFMVRINRELKEWEVETNARHQVVDEKRQALVKAMQERKSLERLKHRKEMQHLKEQGLEEQRFIDEIATSRYYIKSLASETGGRAFGER